MSRELVQWEVWTKILAGKPDLEPLQIPRVADNGRGYISNFGYKHLYLSLDLDFLKKKNEVVLYHPQYFKKNWPISKRLTAWPTSMEDTQCRNF